MALVSEIGKLIAVEARAKWVDGRAANGSSSEFFGLSFMGEGIVVMRCIDMKSIAASFAAVSIGREQPTLGVPPE